MFERFLLPAAIGFFLGRRLIRVRKGGYISERAASLVSALFLIWLVNHVLLPVCELALANAPFPRVF